MGEGYTKELVVDWSGTADSNGIVVEIEGGFTPRERILPERPTGSPDRPTVGKIDPCIYVEATSYSEKAGVSECMGIGQDWYVTGHQDDNYILFENADFGENGAAVFAAKIASNAEGAQIEVVLDGVGGTIIGTLDVPKTSYTTEWQLVSIPVEKAVGERTLVFRFKNILEGCYVNLHTFRFVVDDGRLDRSKWVVSANANSGDAHLAINDNLETRWCTKAPQSAGNQFIIDLGAVQTFNTIVLDAGKSRNDYPRGYRIHVSENGVDYPIGIAWGAGEVITTITFAPQTARFIRITQTGSDEKFFWSIHEVNVFYH